MAKTNNKKLRFWMESLLYVGVIASTSFVLLNQDLRESLQAKLLPDYRKVLSTVTGDLLNNGSTIKVVKIATRSGLFLEVYGDAANDSSRPLWTKITLPDRHDGYFHIQGQAANLALKDVDNDDIMEILAPTFDNNMVAHLNVYRYNPDSQSFEPVVD